MTAKPKSSKKKKGGVSPVGSKDTSDEHPSHKNEKGKKRGGKIADSEKNIDQSFPTKKEGGADGGMKKRQGGSKNSKTDSPKNDTLSSRKKKKSSRQDEANDRRKGKKKKHEEDSGTDEESSESETSEDESSNDGSTSDSSSSGGDKKIKKKTKGSSSDEDDGEEDENDAPFFTDENAAWLKPKSNKKTEKSNLLESEDEDDESGGSDGSDEDGGSDRGSDDEEDDEDLLEIEKEARIVDAEIEAEKREAEEEMRRTVREHTSVYHLPTPEELEKDVDRVVPPSEIRSHIESILEVLAEFKSRREQGRSRKEYVAQLGSFMAELYGYLPELIEYFLTMFSPAETLEFVDASDKPRPLVIRTNTLKARRKDLAAALMKRGVSLDPLASWSKVGLKIVESPVPIGATPEYLGGLYMLQSAASMCPVLALSPEPKESVLDMSSAPGGKTSHIAQLMRNTGVILANDLKPERQKATVANMHRLGVKNIVACAHDGRKMGHAFKNRFDRVLLDAPCSGLGVISRDPSVKVQRTLADINQCAHLQKELLLSAIDSLKYKGTTGGVMVYSTCSVSVAENEEVVNYALSKRDIRIIPTGLDFGKPGYTRYQHRRFDPSVALTRRFYPHVHNMDGFFVAKIQKLSDKRPGQEGQGNEEANVEKTKEDSSETEKSGDDQTKGKSKRKKGVSRSGKATDEKKRKQEDADVNPSADIKPKKTKVSIPPPMKKTKKPKQNAKVTKPRRKKANAMEA